MSTEDQVAALLRRLGAEGEYVIFRGDELRARLMRFGAECLGKGVMNGEKGWGGFLELVRELCEGVNRDLLRPVSQRERFENQSTCLKVFEEVEAAVHQLAGDCSSSTEFGELLRALNRLERALYGQRGGPGGLRA